MSMLAAISVIHVKDTRRAKEGDTYVYRSDTRLNPTFKFELAIEMQVLVTRAETIYRYIDASICFDVSIWSRYTHATCTIYRTYDL